MTKKCGYKKYSIFTETYLKMRMRINWEKVRKKNLKQKQNILWIFFIIFFFTCQMIDMINNFLQYNCSILIFYKRRQNNQAVSSEELKLEDAIKC